MWLEYVIEVMQRLGFGPRWRDLICFLWANRILLNGIPGKPIRHHRGLWQGDPLSPMLFILAMDPLQKLLDKARTRHSQSYRLDPIKMRTSLYAEDTALLIRPTVSDITNLQQLLTAFGAATGLLKGIGCSLA
jgi:hypothetical protein